MNNVDEPDNVNYRLNGNNDDSVTVKLLCGADLLESFATPGLWSDEDVCIIYITRERIELMRAITRTRIINK